MARRPALAEDFSEQAAAWDAEVQRTGVRSLFIPRAANAIPDGNNVDFEFRSVEDAFPDVKPGVVPCGSNVLVMIRQPMLRTAGGIEISADMRKTEHDNTQVARVVALGPLAFHSRDTYKSWPEGAWCQVGDFVRVPKYQGDRWAIAYARDDVDEAGRKNRVTDYVHFVQFRDLSILGVYPTSADALAAKAFY